MKKTLLTLLCTCLTSIYVWGQGYDLHIPKEIQAAYKKGTRQKDGSVSPTYWQNRSDYNIQARFNPQTRMINGEATINYSNNSPDSLRLLVFRLYQDRYKKTAMRDADIAAEDLHDGVVIKKLVIGGVEYDAQKLFRRGTNLFVRLGKENLLLPKAKTEVKVSWEVQMPISSDGRTGRFDESSFFIAYWFPQIAVYDDISGWDMYNYTGTAEFYNDFGNFDVKISVPKNFLVWATGVWQNPQETLTETYLQRYTTAKTSDKVVNIVTADDVKKGGITQAKDSLTYHFKADYVPDFAWATSDHYLWDAGSVVVEDNGRRVVVGAAYKKESKDFYEVAEIGLRSVEFLSKEMPAVPFPYPNLTVFNGTGGMEFPMMVNDGSTSPRSDVVFVTSHEIAHTYFPFYMGINERKYAFMDEGFAQFLPMGIQSRLAPEDDSKMNNIQSYAATSGREAEMPMMMPSHLETGFTYGIASYYRPGTAYVLLEELLGKELFSKALKEYMKNWNGKHPMPYDFYFTFNKVANQDLSWFWKPWFFEIGVADLAVTAEKSGKITVTRKGALPVPINLTLELEDGTKEYFYESAAVWKDGKKEFSPKIKTKKAIKKVVLGSQYIPDADEADNVVEVK
jgi:hypothetical protein